MLKVYVQDNKPPVVVPTWKVPFLYLNSYVYNLLRKPLVYFWKQDLEQLAKTVQSAIKTELLPELYDNMRQGCNSCRDLYGFLRGAGYVSQIKQVIEKEYCSRHYEPFHMFRMMHEDQFKRNHELADKICGFRSNEK